ncbi:FadR/GntR family transcriptional regulator [Tropicimonas sediminicola]|uniref:Pyruvate dehydrogenase complex repressor n=1 Tax=Tropicimonas sediminicola TaxID=1031541 RepID=A0A239CLA9_9RHOB|nr:FCD domain-containing protein [Tropicimonas sediminicola]SNS20945.1 transcriptional regulator, GntR family [Tropicimonas sediminicola]
MPFTPVDSEKLSQAVVRQIELLILRGVLRPGERLPAERDLAERLAVSRPSLREALSELEERGLILRRASAGIFVADVLGPAFSEPLIRLFSAHDEAVFDFIAFRRDIEGLAAERAARLGSDTDLAVIAEIFRQMETAHEGRSGSEEARLDAEFHMAIIEAGHNLVTLHMMRAMYQLLQEGVFFNRKAMFRQRTTRVALLDQHRAVHDAIRQRDPAAARTAVEAHLDYVQQAMLDQRRADHHEMVARQRLQHASNS